MNVYKTTPISDLLSGNSYAGRGIVIGKSANGKSACTAYFIMGRSASSRNRVFELTDDVLYTKPLDPAKVEAPDLIIYSAVRRFENRLIVTNGDQTDTVFEGLKQGKSFSQSLATRRFEPDAPNLTPRISGMLTFGDGGFSYEMSILKSADADGTACNRFTFSYSPIVGVGHFIHTYSCDGNPLPAFTGEPERVCIPDSIDAFTEELWDALDGENRISLFVRYTDLDCGGEETRIINGNRKGNAL